MPKHSLGEHLPIAFDVIADLAPAGNSIPKTLRRTPRCREKIKGLDKPGNLLHVLLTRVSGSNIPGPPRLAHRKTVES